MRLSTFISETMEPILQAWEDFARTIDPPAISMDREALRDHASQMLKVIVKDLNQRQTSKDQFEKSRGNAPRGPDDTAAESHADARLHSGYTIDQIVSEFRALRASVLRLWSESNGKNDDIDPIDIIRFNEAIDQALAESVGRYAHAVTTQQNMFLSILGRDLKAPLSALIPGASMIMSTTYIASKHHEIATGIFKSGQRMFQLVNDLLDFTHTQLGSKLDIKLEKTDIVNICLGAIEELRTVYPEHSIEFSSNGSRKGVWDESRIAQVFYNLIADQLQQDTKASPVKVHIETLSNEVLITINNQSTTIVKEKIGTLFDPLVRFDQENKGNQPTETRFGIGLYIARQIVEAHKGSIEVESSKEQGTTFMVHLPTGSDLSTAGRN